MDAAPAGTRAATTRRVAYLEELRELARLGLPIMLAQVFQMGMGVLDAIMAGRLSAVDLAGVTLGGSLLWPFMVLASGVLMATTPLVSQMRGAGSVAGAGEIVRQGLWLALVAAVLLVVWLLAAPTVVLRFMDVDAASAEIAARYLAATAFGMPAVLCYFLLRYLCEGMGRTRPAMVIAGCALLLKVPLNYAFIYGEFGAPALGGAGCGVSFAILTWLELAAIFCIVAHRSFRETALFARFSLPDPAVLKRYLHIGGPIGLTAFMEVGVFSFVTVLIGVLGAAAVAAHQIALTINGLVWMVPMSFGVAASIRVGFNVGAGRYDMARQSAATAMAASVAYALFAMLPLLLLREPLTALYTHDADVQAVAMSLLLFVTAYQFADDTQVVAIGALRGYKDTRPALLIALASYWLLGLPVAAALGYGWLGLPALGVYGFWVGLALGLVLVAVAVSLRLYRLANDEGRIRALAAT